MKSVLKWFFPQVFFENPAYFRAFVLALVYGALLVSQLFTYEKFAEVAYGYGLPGGMATAWVVVVIVPVLELGALPYLLSMKIGTRMRTLSKWSALLVPIVWSGLLLWMIFSGNSNLLNSGLFGATLATFVGPWLLVLMGLMLWAIVLVLRELPVRYTAR